MAYSSSPQFQTYKTVKVKFDGEPGFRSGDLSSERDLQIVNMYYDRMSQENKERIVRLMKRDGLTTTAYSLSKAASSDELRGYFNDTESNTFYWAVNNKLYSVSPDVGSSIRTVATLTTSSGYVGFSAFRKATTSTRYILASDGTDLWVDDYVAVSCTKVVDADMPTPHQPYPVTIDGYVFLIKSGTEEIWNSDVDDPFAWTAGAKVNAELASDKGLRLFRIKNYVVCFGTGSIEYFWDAAATPSPLSRYDSPIRNVGYITGGTQTDDVVFFVGQDDRQNIGVYKVENFKVDRISTPVVDRTLQTFSSTANAKSNVPLGVDGFILSTKGHSFYVVVTDQTTWVYDLDVRIWYEWKGSDGTGLKVEATWAMFNGGQYVAIAGQTYMSLLTPSVYQDFGTNFTCRYTTEDNDFDTMNWKVCHRTMLRCSMHNYTGTSNATVTWSDNDWGDGGSTTAKNINVFGSSPFISKCGRFRNRSWRIEYTDNYPFFMSGLELDINVYGV
jgi:hypothetical protein